MTGAYSNKRRGKAFEKAINESACRPSYKYYTDNIMVKYLAENVEVSFRVQVKRGSDVTHAICFIAALS